ncbi:MAG: phosphate-starvation-inducible PsiE family protein, partial [Caldimicrobium sp.]|nr:phosphate-starvation-inducible PsiE family protein [Caldimicrobium sp.]
MDIKKFLKPQAIHAKLGDLLETLEEIIVFILTILLLILSLRALYDIAVDLFVIDISFISLIPKFIYVFILIELFRLMIVYLLERRLDTSLIIKTTLIAILRETIIKAPPFNVTRLYWSFFTINRFRVYVLYSKVCF